MNAKAGWLATLHKLICLITLPMALPCMAQEAVDSALKDVLVQAVKQNESRLKSFQATYEVTYPYRSDDYLRTTTDSAFMYEKERVTYTGQGEKYHYHATSLFKNGKQREQLAAFNGLTQVGFSPENKAATVKAERVNPDGDAISRFTNLCIDDLKMSEFLGRCHFESVEQSRTNERETVVARVRHFASTTENPVDVVLHFDVECGMVPIRIETIQKSMSEQPALVCEAGDFIEAEAGLFLPTKASITTYRKNSQGHMEKRFEKALNVESWAVNEVYPDETFTVDLPNGTLVGDQFLDRTFTVGGVGLQQKRIDEALNTGVEGNGEKTAEAGQAGQESSRSVEALSSAAEIRRFPFAAYYAGACLLALGGIVSLAIGLMRIRHRKGLQS